MLENVSTRLPPEEGSSKFISKNTLDYIYGSVD